MINKTHVGGLVYENGLELRTAGAEAKNPGMEYVIGKIHILTGEDNVVSVDIYEPAVTSKGNKNTKFDTAKALIDAKTVLIDGPELATAVRIDSAISLNEWYRPDGELVSTPRNFGGFIHIIPKANPYSSATFEVDILITNTLAETKKGADGTVEETGRLIVNGYIFDFRNSIMPMKFIVENPNGVKFFKDMEPNTFTKVWGKQVSATFKSTKVEENAFGEDKVIETEYTRKEWVITGAMKEPYIIDESTLTAQEIKDALANRNVYLAEIKKRAEERVNKTSAATKPTNISVGGFTF